MVDPKGNQEQFAYKYWSRLWSCYSEAEASRDCHRFAVLCNGVSTRLFWMLQGFNAESIQISPGHPRAQLQGHDQIQKGSSVALSRGCLWSHHPGTVQRLGLGNWQL